MSAAGRKHRGIPTIRERLMVFLLTNPDKYLTIEQVAVMFEVNTESARSAIQSMVMAGLASWDGFRGRAYRVGIGPRLIEMAGPVFKEKFGVNPFVDTRA